MCKIWRAKYVFARNPLSFCEQALSDFSYWHALWQWDLDNHARSVWFLCGSTISTICFCSWYPRTFDALYTCIAWNAQCVSHQRRIHTYAFDARDSRCIVACACERPPPHPCNAYITLPGIGRESQPSHRNVWSTRGKCAFLSSSFPHRRRLHGESKQSQMQAFVRFSTLAGSATHPSSFLCSICSKMRS